MPDRWGGYTGFVDIQGQMEKPRSAYSPSRPYGFAFPATVRLRCCFAFAFATCFRIA